METTRRRFPFANIKFFPRDNSAFEKKKICQIHFMALPVNNIAQMREWERATWATGQTEAEVIRRVGQKIAARARELTRPGDTILILAGRGNNGADARAAQNFLSERKVELLEVNTPETDLPKLESLAEPALIIDGLFGIGLNRALDDGWKKFIATINASK